MSASPVHQLSAVGHADDVFERLARSDRLLTAKELANILAISPKTIYSYGLDFCPAFWDWIIANNASGGVFSIEKVGDEVLALADELSVWADARGAGFFLRPDAEVFPALAAVSAWASGQRYEPSAVSTFLQVADYYLVAHALAGQHTVVSHEVPSASTRKIKTPDACIGLGIKCMTPFEMLRRERARFVLGPQA